MKQEQLIPKRIHLTWFSGDEYPETIRRCLRTWQELLPDFEVKIWTMDMARALNIDYVNEALDAKKWAFAGDVVRAYAVWSEGGVYMDTDIFLLKRFDWLLNYPMVFFMEINEKRWVVDKSAELVDKDGHCLFPETYVKGRQIQAAMFMAQKGHWCLKEIVDYYKNLHFVHDDGNLGIDLISPWIYSKVLEKHGFLYVDKFQEFNDIKVFDSSYVGTNRYEYSKNAIALHLAEHAWDKRTGWRLLKFKVVSSPAGPFLKKILRNIRGY